MEGTFCLEGFYKQRDKFVNHQAKRAMMVHLEIPRSLPNFAKFDRGPFCLDELGEPDVMCNEFDIRVIQEKSVTSAIFNFSTVLTYQISGALLELTGS